MSDLEAITAKLSRVLKPLSRLQNADAAVVVILKYRCGKLEVLLVERAESSKDPWSGQMALPGGKRDPKDKGILQTAVRETLEETNIDLTKEHKLLGALKNARSGGEPSLTVTPLVALVKGESSIKRSKELIGHLWIRLNELGSRRGTAKLPSGVVQGYILDEGVVWGLTYRILEQLFRVLES
jgi:8-oxo-dGTP diphosphatase